MLNAIVISAAVLLLATQQTTPVFSAVVLNSVKVQTSDSDREVKYVSPLSAWFDEMRSSDGWDLGAGLSLHLDTVNQDKQTKSLLERRAIRLDFNGIGMRVGKAIGKDELDLGFYADGGEGRQKSGKNSEYLLHAMFGFNLAGIVAFTLAAFGAIVLKSLVVAKLAFAVAAYMMIKKLFGGGHSGHLMRQSYELMEPHPSDLHPAYIDYNYSPAYGTYGYPPSGASASSPLSGSNPYLAYTAYDPTGASGDISADTSNVAYAIADPPAGGGTAGSPGSAVAAAANLVQATHTQQQSQQQQVQRRRDLRRKPLKHVTLNKYTKLY